MSQASVQRRLAAILVGDVAGYSRLLGEDETGTLAALKQRRKQIVEPLVREKGGRIVKFMGDGVLVEFASADFFCAITRAAGRRSLTILSRVHAKRGWAWLSGNRLVDCPLEGVAGRTEICAGSPQVRQQAGAVLRARRHFLFAAGVQVKRQCREPTPPRT